MKRKNHSRAICVADRITVLKNRKVLTCGVTLMLAQAAYGASGNWTGSGGDANWTTTGNWTATPVPGAGDTATFNDPSVNTDETIYTNGSKTLASIIFSNTGATTISGGTAATSATDRVTFSGGITVNAGAGAVTIGSTGAITTYLGAPNVTFINNSANLLTLTTTTTSVASSGAHTLTLDGSGSSSSGGITGSSTGVISVVKNGIGTWTLASNGYAGGTIINSGTILMASSNAFGTVAQTLTINGGTISTSGSSGRNVPTNISIVVGGDFSLAGATKDVDFSGPVDLNNTASDVTRTVTVNNGGSTWGGVVSSSGAGVAGLTKAGNSSLTLTNSGNTYTGLTTVSAGNLVWGANDVIATGGLTVNGSNAVANLGSSVAHTDSVGTVTLDGGGTITGTAGSILTSTASFELKNGTVSVVLDGAGIPLNKTTSGTVTLSAANTYTGPTTISDGILQLANSAALSTSAVTMNGVRIGLSNGVNIPNAITLGPSIGATGHGLIESNDTSGSSATYSGTINITATPTNGGHFAALSGNTLAVSGAITSTVPVTQRTGLVLYGGGGTGYTALSVTGTGGLLNDDGIATSATVNIGVSGAGTLDLTGFNQTLAGITSTANTAIITNSVAGTKTLTVGNNDVTSTFNGAIQNGAGSVALAKIGNGTTALGGALNVTSSTTVSAGTLALTENPTPVITNRVLQTGALTITGGQLDVANNKVITTSSRSSTEALVASGRTGGTWSGTGIVTTEDDAIGGSALTTLATATAGDIGYGGTKTFGGQTVNSTDTLVMYTYAGDTNLDGKINGDDYFRIDQGYASVGALTGYENGDLNYDGRIDADDYFIIDKNYGNQSLGVFSTASPLEGLAGVSAVPEPASLGLLVLATAGLLPRRRQRR